ncbi:hypothetical protein Scep_005032 [Stephania cephalantha]|uniref:Glycine-rich protein n=1 Tax=Stephania cephalantha TaxID=152367 RepID=A0AAP0KTJ2_9MAGN
MKSTTIVLLLMVILVGSCLDMVLMSNHGDMPEGRANRIMGGYAGSSIDNHHGLPRQRYDGWAGGSKDGSGDASGDDDGSG